MDIATFEDRLDLYGGDLALWPAAERGAAAALLAASGDAQGMLAAMAEVELVLRRRPEPADAGVVDRTVARATRHRQETRARLLVARAGWGAAAAAVLVLGLAIGGMSPSSDASSPERVVAVAFDASGTADVE